MPSNFLAVSAPKISLAAVSHTTLPTLSQPMHGFLFSQFEMKSDMKHEEEICL